MILALDTTSRAGSAALVRDGAILVERAGDPAETHGQRLPRDLMRLLGEAGVPLSAVDLFAVAAGPGSFTGLRVGIATMQGLAMAAGRRIVPVSALQALARAARGGGAHLAPWIDAQRGEVFAALYAPDARTPVFEPSSEPPERTLERWGRRRPAGLLRFIGDGAARYREAIVRLDPSADVVATPPSLAGVVGTIAHEQADTAVIPHAVVPIYIRRSDAELARDRKWTS